MHEAQMHDFNSFLTLTYDDEHLPENSTLCHRDIQLFFKRLRSTLGRMKRNLSDAGWLGLLVSKTTIASGTIKYYMAGEYGSGDNTERPHYHACLFGVDFKDKSYFTTRGDNDLYTSDILTKLWRQGHCSIGTLTFESAAYVARYVMKKMNGKLAKAHYERIDPLSGEIIRKHPEYNRMSKGIGKTWIEKYQADVYPHGKTVVNGREINAPRYYDKQFAKLNEQTFQDETQWTRQENAQLFAAHQTPERRAARARVLEAKLRHLRREL